MSNSASSNKYNDPTLPGYDPSKPSGTAPSSSKPASSPSSGNINNDPTLPGYDPSRPSNAHVSSEPKYNPTPRSSLPPHLRGYFRAPKL
ncbi:MAG: hypothetical protein M3O24_01470 [Thermoproteota archaeon]|nr:hypothetical protein [Thermoproteota archaeon]